MKYGVVGTVAAAIIFSTLPVLAQNAPSPLPDRMTPVAGTSLGSVTITRKVLADGQPLPAGTYQVRLTNDEIKAVVGQSPESARYVEFVRSGKVVGREVATVISNTDIATVAKYRKPALNAVRVETLKGADYLRVWINRNGTNYLIHLPPA